MTARGLILSASRRVQARPPVTLGLLPAKKKDSAQTARITIRAAKAWAVLYRLVHSIIPQQWCCQASSRYWAMPPVAVGRHVREAAQTSRSLASLRGHGAVCGCVAGWPAVTVSNGRPRTPLGAAVCSSSMVSGQSHTAAAVCACSLGTIRGAHRAGDRLIASAAERKKCALGRNAIDAGGHPSVLGAVPAATRL